MPPVIPKLPTLTIVVGRPGSGKTTLARSLANRVHCPLISRDAIKEGMVNTEGNKGSPGGSLSVDACFTFFEVIDLLLARRVTLIAEAFFGPGTWESRIDGLKTLASVRLVVCRVDPEVAHQRVLQRRSEDVRWDEFHNAPVDQTRRPVENYQPPQLGVPTLVVNCSEGYFPGLEEVVRFVEPRPPQEP